MKIYLCGPIDGVTPEWATGWRQEVAKRLPDFLDPTAGKDLYNPDANTTLYSPEKIVKADLDMIWRSDVLLVDWRSYANLEFDSTGLVDYREEPLRVGTIMEIAYAHQWGKQIITFGNLRRGYWIQYHADKHFETLDEAIEYLEGIA